MTHIVHVTQFFSILFRHVTYYAAHRIYYLVCVVRVSELEFLLAFVLALSFRCVRVYIERIHTDTIHKRFFTFFRQN